MSDSVDVTDEVLVGFLSGQLDDIAVRAELITNTRRRLAALGLPPACIAFVMGRFEVALDETAPGFVSVEVPPPASQAIDAARQFYQRHVLEWMHRSVRAWIELWRARHSAED